MWLSARTRKYSLQHQRGSRGEQSQWENSSQARARDDPHRSLVLTNYSGYLRFITYSPVSCWLNLLNMPRGIPNARKDENSMRYTSFHVPLQSV
jgi:hypothetical protein